MSTLLQPNNDDYPDAAGKHLLDAKTLLTSARYDGASYLAGYVVECSLKSLLQLEAGTVPRIHRISELSRNVAEICMAAGASTSRYVTPAICALHTAPIAQWQETIRYRSPCMGNGDASAWLKDAEQVYQDTVASMILDGVM